jgi:hypothetical protein
MRSGEDENEDEFSIVYHNLFFTLWDNLLDQVENILMLSYIARKVILKT